MAFLSEAPVELASLEQLRGLGYRIEREEDIGPDGRRPERESYDEVVLRQRFEDAVARLNPGLALEPRGCALLNDNPSAVSPAVIDALENDDLKLALWSQREQVREVLTA